MGHHRRICLRESGSWHRGQRRAGGLGGDGATGRADPLGLFSSMRGLVPNHVEKCCAMVRTAGWGHRREGSS